VKTLVVYYSRTGKVKKAALSLAKELNADICEIEDNESRKGIFGFIKSGRQAVKNKLADIKPIKGDLKDYELVVLCSQVWAGKISSPARAFLNEYKSDINFISYLLMHGAKTEYIEVMDEMDAIVGKTRKWSISLSARSDFDKTIKEFVEKI
jgi:flavodoxin